MSSRIDRLLADARARLQRLSPEDLPAALGRGAVLVDIRPRRSGPSRARRRERW